MSNEPRPETVATAWGPMEVHGAEPAAAQSGQGPTRPEAEPAAVPTGADLARAVRYYANTEDQLYMPGGTRYGAVEAARRDMLAQAAAILANEAKGDAA